MRDSGGIGNVESGGTGRVEWMDVEDFQGMRKDSEVEGGEEGL